MMQSLDRREGLIGPAFAINSDGLWRAQLSLVMTT
jgi:hypothetical protein